MPNSSYSKTSSRAPTTIDRDIIKQLGFVINFSTYQISCLNTSLPFNHRLATPTEVEPSAVDAFIKNPAPTDKANLVANAINHLPQVDQPLLKEVLQLFNKLFSSNLGLYKGQQIQLKLTNPSTKPIYHKPYSVFNHQRLVLKQYLQDLVHLEVLRAL